MQAITDDIKNKDFKRVYLLYGEEAYLKRSYRKMLSDAAVPGTDTINRAVFSGKGIDTMELMDLANTLPFMSDRRLVVVEESGFFKNAVDDELVDFIKSRIPDECVIIFDETEVDKRSRMYKAVTAAGTVQEMKTPDEGELKRWIAGYLNRSGKKIRQNTAELLLEWAGTDMESLSHEMDKLISFTGEEMEIRPDDIREICSIRISNSIFSMIDAVAEGKAGKALDMYYELIQLKEPPLRILFLLAREFQLLLLTKDMSERGLSQSDIAKAAKVPPFAVRKYRSAAGKFSRKGILKAVNDCVQAEQDVKTGKLEDRLAVELILLKEKPDSM
ncbi:MAG: DNA polymerase III subunit delta [Lachnospiraceae bacterium]|nr:DNA polymerase III subunit delta [Lachnospiraceae bacterium]